MGLLRSRSHYIYGYEIYNSYPIRQPIGFLGMLTFVIFIILGITGALLMLWYEPILDRAWDSVENINDVIPYRISYAEYPLSCIECDGDGCSTSYVLSVL